MSNTASTRWEMVWDVSRLMPRAFLNRLLLLRLWDSTTVSLVSLFTSWVELSFSKAVVNGVDAPRLSSLPL